MLSDKLRDGANSKAFKALLAVILFSFVLTGVGGYLIPRLNTDPVTIGDYKISAYEWTEQYNRRAQQLNRFGPQTAELLENPHYVAELKKQVLESMVDNVAFNSTVWDMDVRIGDAQVRDVIRRTPAFQKDGKFDNDLYLATVRNMGLSPEYFGEQLRTSLMSESISQPLMQISSLPLPYEVNQIAQMLGQKRIVNLYTLDDKSISERINVSEEEAKAYYQANNDKFMAPANVRFNYLLLSLTDLIDLVEVNDEKLEEYFNLYSEDFTIGEQRRLSHIIILKDDKKAQDKINKIEQALSKAQEQGNTKEVFTKLAKTYSADKDNKDQGGDMGLVSNGQLANNLDSALFNLKNIYDVSDKIEDSYGTHFIMLTDIKEPHVPELKEVKDKVTIAYKKAQARELYNNKITTMSDLSFENPDSLDATAEALDIKVQESPLIAQGDTKAKWPFNTEAVQKLAFDEEVYSSAINSQVINIDEEHAIVINVLEHHDAHLKDFDAVKDEALALVRQDKINTQSTKELENLAKNLQQDNEYKLPKYVKSEQDITVEMGSNELSPALSQAIFALPKTVKNAYTIDNNKGVQTLAMVKEIQVADSEVVATFEQVMKAQLGQYLSTNAQSALYRQARSLSTIEYHQDAIDLVTKQNEAE